MQNGEFDMGEVVGLWLKPEIRTRPQSTRLSAVPPRKKMHGIVAR